MTRTGARLTLRSLAGTVLVFCYADATALRCCLWARLSYAVGGSRLTFWPLKVSVLCCDKDRCWSYVEFSGCDCLLVCKHDGTMLLSVGVTVVLMFSVEVYTPSLCSELVFQALVL